MEKVEYKQQIVVDATSPHIQYLKDVLHHRELFYFFAWRDIIVRYKEAFFGISWAIIRPVLNMFLFSFLFGKIANLPSDGVDYQLFVLAGIIPWQLTTNTIVDSCTSILNNGHLVSKVFFPRVIIPCTQIAVHLLDACIAIVFLMLLVLFKGAIDVWTFLYLPPFMLLSIIFCLGSGFWLSALTVKYRDFRFIIQFVIQFSFFICPIGYGSFLIPHKWSYFYSLNPIVGIIDGFRWAFFGITHPGFIVSISISAIVSIILLITGFRYFRKVEDTFADKI